MQISKNLVLFLKGVGMGAADVVPGVSGGTIAFITGIYEELIASLRSINPLALHVFFRDGPGAFWLYINGSFLLVLLSGIVFSFLSLAHLVTYLLDTWPLLLWSFFFGLVLASGIHIARKLDGFSLQYPFAMAAGFLVAWAVTSGNPLHSEPGLPMVFLAGMIAICAMILPGISGSFILVLLGMYSFIMTAIKELDIKIVFIFMLGCVTGLLSFVHLLAWLLKRFHDLTISVLTGFLFGSLNALWPWKKTLMFDSGGDGNAGSTSLAQSNILPSTYESLYQADPMLIACIFLALMGFFLVMSLEFFAKHDD